MKTKFKYTWDYLGWKQYGDNHAQKEWNQTLITKINQTSAQIIKESYIGGADTVIVHPKTFCLIQDLMYFDSSKMQIGGRFNVIIDETINPDTIYVKRIYDDLERIKKTKINSKFHYGYKISDDDGDVSALSIKFFELDPNETLEYTKDGYKIVTEEMLSGEITVLNLNEINPETGELVLDYHNIIPQDIWLPQVTHTIGDSDILAYNQSRELENVVVSDLEKNYLYKNITPREEQTSFLTKLKNIITKLFNIK